MTPIVTCVTSFQGIDDQPRCFSLKYTVTLYQDPDPMSADRITILLRLLFVALSSSFDCACTLHIGHLIVMHRNIEQLSRGAPRYLSGFRS